jgi:hypothetical protein
MKTYVEFFATRDEAYAQMLEKNMIRTSENREPGGELFCSTAWSTDRKITSRW